MNRFFRELDDGARLDVAPGVDVVGDAGGRRAQGLALAIEICVDDDDRLLRISTTKCVALELLLGSQGQLRIKVLASMGR